MASVPTHNDLFLAGRREALLSPTRFNRAIIDTDGSDVNIVFNSSAAMGDETTRYMMTALNELGLATARGEALDRWVYDRYQLVRKEASNAVVTLTLSRTGTIGFTIRKGSLFGTATGIVFTTQNDVAFASDSTTTLDVLATADQTGTLSNVVAGTITDVITALEDTTTTVTNDEAAAGGRDQETDDELRDRAREFFVTARRGTKSAIEFGALDVARITQANAIETFDETTGLPGFRVTIFLSDSDGLANTALSNEVSRNLDEFRALGVPVQVVPAIPQYIDIVASGLQFDSGANTTQVLQNASNAILAVVNAIEPGATLRKAALTRALQATNQLIVPDGAITDPAGDLVPTTGTVIRTTRDRIQLGG